MKKKLISMAAICLCLMNLTGCDGTAMSEAGLNTLMGMGIVFLVLIFISFIIWLMGFIPKMMSGEKKTAQPAVPATPAAPAPTINTAAPAVSEEPEELSDDLELVAVITAAIMASMGEEAPEDGLVVRSIRKRTARSWKNA